MRSANAGRSGHPRPETRRPPGWNNHRGHVAKLGTDDVRVRKDYPRTSSTVLLQTAGRGDITFLRRDNSVLVLRSSLFVLLAPPVADAAGSPCCFGRIQGEDAHASP